MHRIPLRRRLSWTHDNTHEDPDSLNWSFVWKNVFLLTMCYCFGCAVFFVQFSTTGPALTEIGESGSATIPTAIMQFESIFSSLLVPILVRKFSPNKVFVLSGLLSMFGCFLQSLPFLIGRNHLVIVSIGSLFHGPLLSTTTYLRQAVVQFMPEKHKSTGVAILVLGGLVSAALGPRLTTTIVDLIPGKRFAASYLLLMLYAFLFAVLSGLVDFKKAAERELDREVRRHSQEIEHQHLNNNNANQTTTTNNNAGYTPPPPRPLWRIATRPLFAMLLSTETIGVISSTALMSAIPLAMLNQNIPLSKASLATEVNLIGAFLPSLLTAKMAAKFGIPVVSFLGLCCAMVSSLLLLTNRSFGGFLLADFFSGLSWDLVVVSISAELNDCFALNEKPKSQAFIEVFVSSFNMVAAMTVSYIITSSGVSTIPQIYLSLLTPITSIVLCWTVFDVVHQIQRRHNNKRQAIPEEKDNGDEEDSQQQQQQQAKHKPGVDKAKHKHQKQQQTEHDESEMRGLRNFGDDSEQSTDHSVEHSLESGEMKATLRTRVDGGN